MLVSASARGMGGEALGVFQSRLKYLLPVYLQVAGFSLVVPRRSMYSTGAPRAGSSAAPHHFRLSGSGLCTRDAHCKSCTL